MLLCFWFIGCLLSLCAGCLPLCGLLKGYLKHRLIATMETKVVMEFFFYKQQTVENKTVAFAFPDGSRNVHLQLRGLTVDCRFKFAASIRRRHRCSPLFSAVGDASKSLKGFRGECVVG